MFPLFLSIFWCQDFSVSLTLSIIPLLQETKPPLPLSFTLYCFLLILCLEQTYSPHTTSHNPFTKMTSFIGVSSIYQTPTLELYRRTTPTTAATKDNKSLLHFNYVLKAYYNTNTNQTHKPHHSLSLVPSAIATSNSSVLSEEAFKGLGALDAYYDDDDDDNNNSSGAATSTSPEDDHELAVSELGLPQRLVQSLHTRGITHLFPIQVFYPLSLSLSFWFSMLNSLANWKTQYLEYSYFF